MVHIHYWVTELNWTDGPHVFASVSSVQSLSHVRLFVRLSCVHSRLPCPSPTPGACSNSCPSSRWCHRTISSSVVPFSSCLQSFLASGFFPNVSVLSIRWPKYWSFSFSISPSNEYPGLISFRIDWFDLLAVQGTLKNFLQEGVCVCYFTVEYFMMHQRQ